MSAQAAKLEIGPGPERLGWDWWTLDKEARPGLVDIVATWGRRPLPLATASCSLVYAAHVLEHVPWDETTEALREAHRILRPGGEIELHVPDFDVLARAAQEERPRDEHWREEDGTLHWMHWVAGHLFAAGSDPHRACFNERHLRWCLERAGFEGIERDDRERAPPGHGQINLGMRARKP